MQDFFHQPCKVSPTVLEEPSHVVASGDEAPSAPSSDAPVPSVGLGWSCNANIFGFLGLFGTLWRNILRILRYCWVCLDFWDILRCYVNMCSGSISINCILCDLSMPNHLVPKSPFAFGSFKHTDMMYIYIDIYIYNYIYRFITTWNTWTNLFPVWPTVKSRVGSHNTELVGGTSPANSPNSPTANFRRFFCRNMFREATVFWMGISSGWTKKRLRKRVHELIFYFLRDTISARINCWKKMKKGRVWKGRKISQNLKRARLLDLSLWVPLKVAGSLVGNWKTLNVPSYEALVSFGPYAHRISVETYFCWCPPKQGWIKSKVLFPSGRLESH